MERSSSNRDSAMPITSPLSARKIGPPLSPGTIGSVTSIASGRSDEMRPEFRDVASQSPSLSNSSGIG